jgi:hypothetical protein
MGNTSKGFCIILAAILSVSSLIIVESAYAQTFPKPSVPEFTVRIADYSYVIPATTPTYTINPYTGEQEQATSGSAGYHVENKSIEITIKNQPFTKYQIGDKWVLLYYNVSYKGYYGQDWSYYPYNTYYDRFSRSAYCIPWSDSEYTTISFPIPQEGKIDIRVKAQIGYYTETQLNVALPGGPFTTASFTGESSDWSSTQTLTTGSNVVADTSTPTSLLTPSPTETPTITPSSTPTNSDFQLNQSALVVIGVVGVVVAAAAMSVAVYFRKRHR